MLEWLEKWLSKSENTKTSEKQQIFPQHTPADELSAPKQRSLSFVVDQTPELQRKENINKSDQHNLFQFYTLE